MADRLLLYFAAVLDGEPGSKIVDRALTWWAILGSNQ
jgi:hypothetical protein